MSIILAVVTWPLFATFVVTGVTIESCGAIICGVAERVIDIGKWITEAGLTGFKV